MLRADLIDCGDTVSLIVAEHSLFYINTLLWVLDDKQKGKGKWEDVLIVKDGFQVIGCWMNIGEPVFVDIVSIS